MTARHILILSGFSQLAGFVLTFVFLQYGRLDFALLVDAIRYCF